MPRLLPLGLFSLLAVAGSVHGRVIVFDTPIDAVSFDLKTSPYATMRGDDGGWITVAIENEQDPLLTESNLTVFDTPVTRLTILDANDIDVHPIRISHEPAGRLVAATGDVGKSRILTRAEWGADDSLLYTIPKPEKGSSSSAKEKSETTGSEPAGRVKDCLEAQENYPDEFRPARTETTSPDGKTYLWPVQYSPEVKLLAVHHTAMAVGTDPRPAVERVRALYEFHAVNRGWGDIGYNYVIDEAGEIYEGRHGGDNVVAGHAYCNNIGTLGIALLGNFELELPTQEQIQALQWLLANLADHYGIPLDRKIRFHGKSLPTVVAHRDLVSTDCPGYYAFSAMTQIRDHVAKGDLMAGIAFPKIAAATEKLEKKTEERKAQRVEQRVVGGRSTGPIDRRLAIKLKSQPVTALRRALRNKVEDTGGTARPSYSTSERVVFKPRSPAPRSSSETSEVGSDSSLIRIRLTAREAGLVLCTDADIPLLETQYRGTVSCTMIDGKPALINTVDIESYMMGLAEEPDTEPYEKQKAFAIAARSYAAFYMNPANRKFPGMPYDGSDSPATFQKYGGKSFEKNDRWVSAVRETTGQVLTVGEEVIKAPYFSSDDGRTRSPLEAGWSNFPHADVFKSKDDPWCQGMPLAGHGVGMSGCGAEAQANEGKSAAQILGYYYPGTVITTWTGLLTAKDR